MNKHVKLKERREAPLYEYEEVRIENTNHCGYKCFFCPRDELSREKGYMDVEDLAVVLDRVGNHEGKVDLHGFGEPLLDQDLAAKVTLVKSVWPLARTRIISTLGLTMSDDKLAKLVASGLDTLEISFYGVDRESYKLAHGVDKFGLVKENIQTISRLKKSLSSSIEIVVREFPVHGTIVQDVDRKQLDDWLLGLGISRVSKHHMHNYGGGREYNVPPDQGICSVVWGFRKRVLQVTWDLNIIPCCFDSNSTVIFGNLRDSTLEQIFSGSVYRNFIEAHQRNDLNDYPVCKKCERCFKP